MPDVLALAGGVGGAKLAFGLASLLPPDRLTVVVNTGDDDAFHGLHVSPDIDTVVYTLAGKANRETGWGRQQDTFAALDALSELGAETWFRLGDRDLALHIRRTQLLREGHTLSEVTRDVCQRFGVEHAIVPMSDNAIRTVVETDQGVMSFQEYFVLHHSEPRVRRLVFKGIERATPSPWFEMAWQRADALVICPSNPFLSVDPILSIPGARNALASINGVRIAVSPIIGGKAVRGPAAKLFEQLGGGPADCVGVARRYAGLCTHLVIDRVDQALAPQIAALGIKPVVENTLMQTDDDRIELARAVLAVCETG
ncbi:MAG: 2-phospho-L-lactate transferase [Chloroflexi bacterium]|nr:2-phospho-L-lactate transferase [Chloroflexota bacterium]